MKEARAQIPDLQVTGDPGSWVTLCKASSNQQGWMKSTKAMEIPFAGCLVQVSTQQESLRGPDGRPGYALAEAICFVPGVHIAPHKDGYKLEAGLELPGLQEVREMIKNNREKTDPDLTNAPIPPESPVIIEENPLAQEIDQADAEDKEDNNGDA